MRSRFTLPALWIFTAFAALSPATADAQWQPNGAAACTAANDQLAPAVCSDGVGGAILVWTDSRTVPFGFDLYAQRMNVIGEPQWAPDGVPVCTAAGDQLNPRIVPDGSGGAIVVWEDQRNGNADIFAQRIGPTGSMSWTPDGVALCTDPEPQELPAVASDGAGGAIVGWQDFRLAIADIYAQRVNAAGTVQWTTNGVGVCTADEDQLTPGIVSDGAGGAIFAWQDNRVFDFDLYAQRLNAAGGPQWPANGLAVCVAPGIELNPVLASDGAGGAIIAWEDLRYDLVSFDIFAQRMNASGVPQWAPDGVAVCTNDADQTDARIASDGLGGAIVAWGDKRSGRGDIYAQRMNAAGSPRWSASGASICTAIGEQQAPEVVSDAAGGAIIAWEDQRGSSFNSDLFALRMDSTGTAQWASNGLALTAAPSNQVSGALCPDGLGGAFLAWEDGRSGLSSDIYAQRVSHDGMVGPVVGVADAIPPSLSLFFPAPNPCRAGCTLRVALPRAQRVSADILDPSGRRLRGLAYGAPLSAGTHELAWDGRDEVGQAVTAGVYLIRVRAEGASAIRKVTVLP